MWETYKGSYHYKNRSLSEPRYVINKRRSVWAVDRHPNGNTFDPVEVGTFTRLRDAKRFVESAAHVMGAR